MKRVFFTFFFIFAFVSPVFAYTPNDPFAQQWAFEHVGAYRAWDFVHGSRQVVVAILDNGFDTFHPDLKDNIWINEDEIPNNKKDDDKNGYIDDVYGWNFLDENNNPRPDPRGLTEQEIEEGIIHHGTLVAGLIGAVGNNNVDGAGINWRVKLMNLKVVGNTGSSGVEKVDDAIRYAVDNGADVINISMVSNFEGGKEKELVDAIDYAYEKNVVVVAAAGNNMWNLNDVPLYPICSDMNSETEKVLGVSAIREDHRLAIFSNSGSKCVDIAAPGQFISSTIRFSPTNGLSERYSGGWSGTSFSTPIVSGAAALIKSIQPLWGPSEIFKALLSTVQHTPGQDEETYANLFGAGLLQIDKAVEYALDKIERKEIISFLNYDKITGDVYLTRPDMDNQLVLHPEIKLKDIDDITSFLQDEKTKFATVKRISNKESKVEIFDENFEKVNSWNVGSNGALQIEVGDVIGGESLEIVLANDYEGKELVRVFSMTGELIEDFSKNTIHSGASLTLSKNDSTVKSNILILYQSEENLNLEILEAKGMSLKSKKVIPVQYLKAVGSFTAADIDGDGQDEYIVGAGKGDQPFLQYYEDTGKLINSFFAFSSEYRDGFFLTSADYDSDGYKEVIAYTGQPGSEVKVWNARPLKVGKWWPFVGQKEVNFGVIPMIEIIK